MSNSRSYDRGGSTLSYSGPTPVELGKEYELEVREISHKGDGIAKVQGFVVFVKKGKVGQKHKVKINMVGNTFAAAKIVS